MTENEQRMLGEERGGEGQEEERGGGGRDLRPGRRRTRRRK